MSYFRPYSSPYGGSDRDNCELSDRDSRELDANNPTFFETTSDHDFYERFGGRSGSECLDGQFNDQLIFLSYYYSFVILQEFYCVLGKYWANIIQELLLGNKIKQPNFNLFIL